MTTSLRLRLLPVLVVLLFAALGVAGTAAAGQPSDAGPSQAFPNCLAGQDTGHICKVSPVLDSYVGPEPWQAQAGQWIVIRFGYVDPHEELCAPTQASVVATITLDGTQLPVDTIPCEASTDAFGNTSWLVDYRSLVHPLAPGRYSITVSAYFTSDVGAPGEYVPEDYTPAGTTQTFSTTLTVVP